MILKLTTGKKTVGAKQVKRALNSHEVEAVFIAMDAEKKITDQIIQICKEKDIEVFQVENMNKLGVACGINVNAATAALLK